jgi:hypothetical protein
MSEKGHGIRGAKIKRIREVIAGRCMGAPESGEIEAGTQKRKGRQGGKK